MAVLVLSRALSFLSPVFAAMFNGRFAEGQNLSSLVPLQLPLPDDDPVAMLTLCNIANLRVPELPIENRYHRFAVCAILCDKHQCTDVVRPYSRIWAIKLIKENRHSNFETLVFSTYVLDLHDELVKVTKAIILQRSSVKDSAIFYRPGFLPTFVSDQLQEGQKSAIEAANLVLLGSVSHMITEYEKCDDLAGVHGVIFNFIRAAHIWPPATRPVLMNQRNLKATNPPSIENLCCKRNGCRCKSLPAVQFQLLEELNDIEESIEGLCLDCIKVEGTGVISRSCRMGH